MADTFGHRRGHELGVQDSELWWRVGDRAPKQSVALWLAEHAGLPPVEYPESDLFRPPSAMVEFQPVASGSRPVPDITERNA